MFVVMLVFVKIRSEMKGRFRGMESLEARRDASVLIPKRNNTNAVKMERKRTCKAMKEVQLSIIGTWVGRRCVD